MLAAVQGKIENDQIITDIKEIRPYNGRYVTIIINDTFNEHSEKQDKTKFFSAVGKIHLDRNAVNDLRLASMI